MTKQISFFDGPHAELSNFSLCGNIWPTWWPKTLPPFETTEAAFAAWKIDPDINAPRWLFLVEEIRTAATPGQAKRLGRKVPLRHGWDEMRLDVMRFLLKEKFKPGTLAHDILLGTGDAELIEGNNWNDLFWGAVWDGEKWEGLNNLGLLLMERRDHLRTDLDL